MSSSLVTYNEPVRCTCSCTWETWTRVGYYEDIMPCIFYALASILSLCTHYAGGVEKARNERGGRQRACTFGTEFFLGLPNRFGSELPTICFSAPSHFASKIIDFLGPHIIRAGKTERIRQPTVIRPRRRPAKAQSRRLLQVSTVQNTSVLRSGISDSHPGSNTKMLRS